MSTNLRGSRVWVVGASSGIGAALAHELVRRGASVAVSARDRAGLQRVAEGGPPGTVVVVPLDATDRDAALRATDEVARTLGEPDIVVWSAGYWKQFDAVEWDADAFERHVRVNLLGLNNLLAAVMPRMTGRGAGHFVGIASVAGYRGLVGAEAYGATKAAQINLLEGLRAAVRPHGVRVTTVCPGFVGTPMTAGNDFPMPFMVEAEHAAVEIADGLEDDRLEIVFPLPMAVVMKVARVLPVRLWAAIATRLSPAASQTSRRGATRGRRR